MRREVVNLIESVRELQIQLTPKPDNPDGIRLGGERATFPTRLKNVAEALQELDRVGSAGLNGIPVEDPTLDSAKLRMALDGVFRWMRFQGLDVKEPHNIVAQSLGVEEAKKGKTYRPIPKFAPNAHKKSGSGISTNLNVAVGEKVSLEGLAQKEYQAHIVDNLMGGVLATPGRREK